LSRVPHAGAVAQPIVDDESDPMGIAVYAASVMDDPDGCMANTYEITLYL
jgi:hypothetical protein